ncbi:cytochrome P450 [Hyaloraphidium curvatum]|nr:cytochrome P450 [Hyaloraphidium curvatum]
MDLASLLYALVGIAAFLYVAKIAYRKFFIDVDDDIPTVSYIPLLGAQKDKLQSLHTMSVDKAREHGPVYREVNWLRPWMRTVNITDPNLLKEVYVGKNWNLFTRGHPILESFLPYSEGIIHLPNADTWRELSKRPDLQAAIRKEVEEVTGGAELDNLEVLEKCKVLNACIKETLRRYPSAPGGAGRAIHLDLDFRYTDIAGKSRLIKFRKGDMVNTAIYAIQNMPGFWVKDPQVWSPERFYEEPNGDSKAGLFAYSPFGNGARRCLGERLALGEARLCFASILRKWELEPVPFNFVEIFKGTIAPNKCIVKLKPVV